MPHFEWGVSFLMSAVTSIAFCFVLTINNNLLTPYYVLYGPVSLVLNYQIQWNNIFPQSLWETHKYAGLFKILGFISVLWILYWGLVLGLFVSFVRRKKHVPILILISVVVLINYFSAMFQEWFIGMRTIM